MKYKTLEEIVFYSKSMYSIIEYINNYNLSEGYSIDISKVNHLKEYDFKNKANSMVKVSDNNVEKFLKQLYMSDSDFKLCLEPKKIDVKELPINIKSLGYLITKKNICKHYVDRKDEETYIDIILNKKIKNNVLLVGEPGSGKTTLIEMYAINKNINNIFVVETVKLISNTKYRGEFEKKVEDLLSYSIENNLILFFDEIHTLINLGKSDGGMSITNILKPYLTKDYFKFIGATTNKESQLLLQDEAFKRRFSIVKLPTISTKQLINIKKVFVNQLNIDIDINYEDTINIINTLDKELNNQYFPDKLVDFLDYFQSYSKIYPNKQSVKDALCKFIYINN